MTMRGIFLICTLFLAASRLGVALDVEDCPNGKEVDDYKLVVEVGGCKEAPCILKKGTQVQTAFRFEALKDTKKVYNDVGAIIFNALPLPFIGVDRTEACDNLYEIDGKTKAGCALKKGKQYIFISQIDVLKQYPSLSTKVHWGLKDQDGEHLLCFRVAAQITR